jgi:hypothetical protein
MAFDGFGSDIEDDHFAAMRGDRRPGCGRVLTVKTYIVHDVLSDEICRHFSVSR